MTTMNPPFRYVHLTKDHTSSSSSCSLAKDVCDCFNLPVKNYRGPDVRRKVLWGFPLCRLVFEPQKNESPVFQIILRSSSSSSLFSSSLSMGGKKKFVCHSNDDSLPIKAIKEELREMGHSLEMDKSAEDVKALSIVVDFNSDTADIDECVRFLADLMLMITSPVYLNELTKGILPKGDKRQYLLNRRFDELPKNDRSMKYDCETYRMMASGQYHSPTDPLLNTARAESRRLGHEFRSLATDMLNSKKVRQTVDLILGFEKEVEGGMKVWIEPPFEFDYGFNIICDGKVFINFNCNFLDCGFIFIGDGSMLGPSIDIYTVNHPVDHLKRSEQWEFTLPVEIGNNVWIGGKVVIVPGIRVGNDVVIGAGSAVTRDVPAGSIVGGNPAKVIAHRPTCTMKYLEAHRSNLLEKKQ